MRQSIDQPFTPARDAIDPALAPKRVLNTGAAMPGISLGTFGSDHLSADEIADAVKGAISVGYRHLDCASVYGNEDRIGTALRELFLHGLRREELWITSKLWNDKHAEGAVIPACRQSLADLVLLSFTFFAGRDDFHTVSRALHCGAG